MTNKEAIEELKKVDTLDMPARLCEAHYMAIKALEHPERNVVAVVPCGDTISRQAVLDAMYTLCDTGETLKENPWRDNPHIDVITDAINNLQSVNPQDNKRNCVTCEWSKDGHNAGTEECHLCMWESQYKPKTGHWDEIFSYIEGEVRFYCSECNDYQLFTSRYCPNCGARMVEPQESEDKR